MPRPRKYDYQKDYPVPLAIYLKLPVEKVNQLDELGFTERKELAELTEMLLSQYIEENKHKLGQSDK